MLIAANLVPIVGVLWWGWDIKDILMLFWAENGIIGIFNILKMLFVKRETKDLADVFIAILAKLFLISFFVVHYGLFWYGHGLGILGLIKQFTWTSESLSLKNYLLLNYASLIPLFISHGFSFVQNYLLSGERNKTNIGKLFVQPYSRVVILHLTILFGAIISFVLNRSIGILIILVLSKIIVDIIYHTMEHKKYNSENYKIGQFPYEGNRINRVSFIKWVIVVFLVISVITFGSTIFSIFKSFFVR